MHVDSKTISPWSSCAVVLRVMQLGPQGAERLGLATERGIHSRQSELSHCEAPSCALPPHCRAAARGTAQLAALVGGAPCLRRSATCGRLQPQALLPLACAHNGAPCELVA